MDTRTAIRLTAPRPLRAVARLVAGAALCALALTPAVAQAATYDPLNIISPDVWRASTSMSVADIQAFLATQSGVLGSLTTTDYVTPGGANGYGIPWQKGMPKKSAAQIISDAATYWNINPKMLLVTLQKEQGLLTHYIGEHVSTTPLNHKSHAYTKADQAYSLEHAMGYGVYSGSTNTFPGFGNQAFNAARGYSQFETRWSWTVGLKLTIELQSDHSKKITITPKTWCTYGLYRYTPYYPQQNFWTCFVTYFEDPLSPARLRPVYRFREKSNGTYYYTSSEAKRYTMIRTSPKKWAFEGVAFTIDTSASANTVPLWQMYNNRTHRYEYTASTVRRAALLKAKPRQWYADLIVGYVSWDTSGTTPVYSLENKATHGVKLTSSTSLKALLTGGHHPPYIYRRIAFRLGSFVPTPTP